MRDNTHTVWRPQTRPPQIKAQGLCGDGLAQPAPHQTRGFTIPSYITASMAQFACVGDNFAFGPQIENPENGNPIFEKNTFANYTINESEIHLFESIKRVLLK